MTHFQIQILFLSKNLILFLFRVKNDNSVLVNSDKDAGDALLVRTKAGESKIYSCAAENPFAKNKRIEYRHHIKVDVRSSPQIPTYDL